MVEIAHARLAPDRDALPAPSTLFDRMHAVAQLTDRQHATGMNLLRMWHAAGLDRTKTARLHYGETHYEEFSGTGTPLEQHRRLMREMPPGVAGLLDAACCGTHPGWRAPDMRAGLDRLAERWGITG